MSCCSAEQGWPQAAGCSAIATTGLRSYMPDSSVASHKVLQKAMGDRCFMDKGILVGTSRRHRRQVPS